MDAVAGAPVRPGGGRSSEMFRGEGLGPRPSPPYSTSDGKCQKTIHFLPDPEERTPGFALLPVTSAWSEPDLRWLRSRTTGLAGPSRAQIDDPARRCQFSPAALMAALLHLESAGRIRALPDNRVALLTHEAH